MATGTVKWFNGDKGYGFITPESPGEIPGLQTGKDVYVHVSGLLEGVTSLRVGQRVKFETRKGRRGPEAPEAVLVSPIPEAYRLEASERHVVNGVAAPVVVATFAGYEVAIDLGDPGTSIDRGWPYRAIVCPAHEQLALYHHEMKLSLQTPRDKALEVLEVWSFVRGEVMREGAWNARGRAIIGKQRAQAAWEQHCEAWASYKTAVVETAKMWLDQVKTLEPIDPPVYDVAEWETWDISSLESGPQLARIVADGPNTARVRAVFDRQNLPVSPDPFSRAGILLLEGKKLLEVEALTNQGNRTGWKCLRPFPEILWPEPPGNFDFVVSDEELMARLEEIQRR